MKSLLGSFTLLVALACSSVALADSTVPIIPGQIPPGDKIHPGLNDYEVRRDFAAHIYNSFASPLQRVYNMRQLSPAELTHIRVLYRTSTGSSAPLDALVKLGPTAFQPKYFGDPAGATAVIPHIMLTPRIHKGSPIPDMTIEEIYLEFRTSPFGSLSPVSALYETAKYTFTEAGIAFGFGLAIGSEIHDLIELYDPDLDNAIGGTMENMLAQLQNAGKDAQSADFKNALRALFGLPRSDGATPAGLKGGIGSSNEGWFNYSQGPIRSVTVSEGFPDDITAEWFHK